MSERPDQENERANPPQHNREDVTEICSLDELAQLFASASQNPAICRHFATGTHAGVAVILQIVVTAGHKLAASDLKTYDHRSLWKFTADLDRLSRLPPEPVHPTSTVPACQPIQE
jgi:hypothetical protein